MAYQDYVDPEYGDAEAELFLDDVELAWTGAGNANSGRSDEYLGFGDEIDNNMGYIDWYIYLRTDEWDKHQDEIDGYWANIEVTVGIDVPNPEYMTREVYSKIVDIVSSGYGRTADAVGYDEGSGYEDGLPSDVKQVTRIILDWYGVGDKINASADDAWNPEKVAAALSAEVNKALDEAERIQDKAFDIMGA